MPHAKSGAFSVQDLGLPSLLAYTDEEPWELYEAIAGTGGIVWDEKLGVWLIGSYDLIKEIGRTDVELWLSQDLYGTPPDGMTREDWRWFVGYGSNKTLHTVEGISEHDRMHRWWMRTFSGPLLRDLGDTLVRPIVEKQIDSLCATRGADLWSRFAAPVAPRVVAASMGLPSDDEAWLHRFIRLHEDRSNLFALQRLGGWRRHQPNHDALVEAGMAAVTELAAMLRPIVEERQNGEGDDLVALLWREAPTLYEGAYTEVDIVAAANVVFSGASGTTAATLANALYLVLSDADIQQDVRAGGASALANLVEEALRLFGANGLRVRVARTAIELGGVTISEGDVVIALSVSGGRDAARFAHPHDVDLARRAPRDHMGFQYGRRACPGQGLARTQLAAILDSLLRRMPEMALDRAAPPPRYTGSFVRRWTPLHATYSTRP